MRKRFGAHNLKFYDGGAVNAKNNAGFGYIAKAINENFGVNVKDLSLTQINAYLIELVKARKEEAEAMKAVGRKQTDLNKMPIQDLKNMGVQIKKVIKKV